MDRILFHIHADAINMSSAIRERMVREFSFSIDDFEPNRDGSAKYSPEQHLTFKCSDPHLFNRQFAAARTFLEGQTDFDGYLEGEAIAHDVKLLGGDFDGSISEPFHAESQALPSMPFRESEIHISFPVAGLDGRLRRALFAMGFFVGTMNKPSGLAEIFTIQGNRKTIASLIQPLQAYLVAARGFVSASMKEERIVHHWMSSDQLRLPPQVKAVSFNNKPTVVGALELL